MKSLEKLLKSLGVDKIDEKLSVLENYRKGIEDWNKKVNITKITKKEDFYRLHYLDSLLCTGSSEFSDATRIIDVGTGGGFPGIPMAVVFPEKKFVLMDASRKRLNIMDALAQELHIKNVEVVHGRAEEMARKKEYRGTFDLCVSRAVANLSTLSEYCLGFVKVGGNMIAYKGPKTEEEIKKAKTAIETMGGRIIRVEGADAALKDLEMTEAHKWIYIKKENLTPDKYPRGGGKPKSSPLL